MAGIPQDTTYSKENVASMVGAMKNVGQSIKQHYGARKSVDISPYQGVADRVKSYAPTNIRGLGTETTPYGGSTKFERFHLGTDIANKIGTKIPAFAGGVVTESVTGKKHGEAGFGNYIKILDDQNREWRYSHLENNYVPVGTRIGKGQQIGTMGATGQTYSSHYNYDPNNPDTWGSHLDLRIYDTYKKMFVNPYKFIG